MGIIGHFTGATSVIGWSPVAQVISCGFDVHEFYALVAGERSGWLRFGDALGSALAGAGLPYAPLVHEAVQLSE